MASTSKAFKIVCGKIGTHRDDTHNLCVFCLGNDLSDINQIQRLVLFSAYERVFGGCGSLKKKLFFLVFIGFSILVMLTLCENGYEGMSPVQEMINSLSLCGRHPLSRAWPPKPLNLA